jgi:hypothetical protein
MAGTQLLILDVRRSYIRPMSCYPDRLSIFLISLTLIPGLYHTRIPFFHVLSNCVSTSHFFSVFRGLRVRVTNFQTLLLVCFSGPDGCYLTSCLSFVGFYVPGGSNMNGTNSDFFSHKSSRSYLNHHVHCYLLE